MQARRGWPQPKMPSIMRSRLVQIYRKRILLLAIIATTGGVISPGRSRNSGEPNKLFRNDFDITFAIATIQRRLGHWEEAIAQFRRAIQLNARNVHAYNHLAMTYAAAPFS